MNEQSEHPCGACVRQLRETEVQRDKLAAELDATIDDRNKLWGTLGLLRTAVSNLEAELADERRQKEAALAVGEDFKRSWEQARSELLALRQTLHSLAVNALASLPAPESVPGHEHDSDNLECERNQSDLGTWPCTCAKPVPRESEKCPQTGEPKGPGIGKCGCFDCDPEDYKRAADEAFGPRESGNGDSTATPTEPHSLLNKTAGPRGSGKEGK